MTTHNPTGARIAAESAIRILLKVRNDLTLRHDARFFILRHVAALRVLRSVVA